ncbi:MAG: ribonuclease III domain-containing protein [bacterium]|nr:ribonuclease III domain-containing protein [bacterium]
METSIEQALTAFFGGSERMEAAQYSPLALAYIGDAVFELAVRTKVVTRADVQVNKMHRHTTHFVKAETQARMICLLEDELTETEHAIYKRGRNAKSVTMAKNASMKDYRMATGFEALMGYLYLNGEFSRMMELIALGISGILEDDKTDES